MPGPFLPTSIANAAKRKLADVGRSIPLPDLPDLDVPNPFEATKDVLGDTFRGMTSAEEFLNKMTPGAGTVFKDWTPGTDIAEQIQRAPKVGGGLRTVFDVGLAPATVFSAGIGPEAQASIRALPRAARVPLNLLTPASRSANPFVRLGAETAIGTAGVTAAQEAAERTDNPFLIGAAGLGAGVLAGGTMAAAPKIGRAAGRLNALDDAATVTRRAGPTERSTRDVLPPTYGQPLSPDDVWVRQTPGEVWKATDADVPRGTRTLGNKPTQPVTPAAVRPTSNTGILSEVFGFELPDEGITRGQRASNNVRRLLNKPEVYDAQATPLYQRARQWERQAASVANSVRESLRSLLNDTFQFDDKWRIQSLAGKHPDWPSGPTLADLRAHRPKFEPFLTDAERVTLNSLDAKLGQFEDVARGLNLDLGTRADIEKGGSYTHRTYEDTGPRKVRAKSGGQGGRESYEKVATRRSDEAAIKSGDTPRPPWESIGDYVQEVGVSASDALKAAQTQTFGAQTAASRMSPTIKAGWEKVGRRAASARKTLEAQEVRLTEMERTAGQARNRTGQAIGDLANASVRRGQQYQPTDADFKVVREAVEDSVSEARHVSREIGTNVERLRGAGVVLSNQERALVAEADKLDELVAEAEGYRLGAKRADATATALETSWDSPASQFPTNIAGAFDIPTQMITPESRVARAGADALAREHRAALKARDQIEAQIARMTDRAERLSSRVDNLTERGAILSDLDAASRQATVEASRNQRLIYNLDRKAAVADMEVKLLERAANRAGAVELSAEGRVGAQTVRQRRTQQVLADAIAQRDAMRAQYKRAQDIARQVPRDRGAIDLAELQGTDFPLSVANAANYIIKQDTRQPGVIEEVVLILNNLYRGVTGTLDNSVFGNQLLLAAAGRPKAVSQAALVNAKAWARGGDKALGEFVRTFDVGAAKEGMPTAQDWARHGAYIGANDPEFVLGSGRTAALKSAPGIRQANRAFGSTGTATRLSAMQGELADEMARTGKTWQELNQQMREIADGWNGATGYSANKFGGAAGDYALYAARYFQSRLDTIGRAIQGSVPARGVLSKVTPLSAEAPMDARLARAAMVRLIGAGTMMTVTINAAQGRETDFDPIKDGRWNNNFMRARAGGQDRNLFGPWMPMVRAITMTAMGRPDEAYRGLASGVVKDAWDLAFDRDATGNPTRSDPETFAKWFIGSHTPFGAGDIVEAGKQVGSGGNPVAGVGNAAAAFGGFSSSPMSTGDKFDDASRQRFGKGYRALTPSEKDTLDRENPALTTRRSVDRIRRGGEFGQYESEKLKYAAQQANADKSLADPQEWKKDYQDRQQRLFGAREGILGQSEDDLTTPWGRYYAEVKQATGPDGRVDWDAVDAYRAGLDESENASIDQETGLGGTSRVKEYRQTGRELDKAGYFDLYDRVWARMAPKLGLEEYKTGREFEQAIDARIRERLVQRGITTRTDQDILMGKILDGIEPLKAYRSVVNDVQEAWIKQNASLARQAVKVGYIDPASLRNAEAGAILSAGR